MPRKPFTMKKLRKLEKKLGGKGASEKVAELIYNSIN